MLSRPVLAPRALLNPVPCSFPNLEHSLPSRALGGPGEPQVRDLSPSAGIVCLACIYSLAHPFIFHFSPSMRQATCWVLRFRDELISPASPPLSVLSIKTPEALCRVRVLIHGRAGAQSMEKRMSSLLRVGKEEPS